MSRAPRGWLSVYFKAGMFLGINDLQIYVPTDRERVWPKAVSDLSARKVSRSPMPQNDPGMSFRFSRKPLELLTRTRIRTGRAVRTLFSYILDE